MLALLVILCVLLNSLAFGLAVISATSADKTPPGAAFVGYIGAALFMVVGAFGWVWVGARIGGVA